MLGRSLLTDHWTAEKAWWLGATLGDGHSDNRVGRRHVTFVSGDLDLVTNWASLARDGGMSNLHRRTEKGVEQNSWSCSVGDIALSSWLAGYSMDGRKGSGVLWPKDVPMEYMPDLIRGLWDTDGCISVARNRDGNRRDTLICNFANKAPELVDGMISVYPYIRHEKQTVTHGRYKGNVYELASVRGEAAVNFIRTIYGSAPEHLRCNRKYEIAANYLKWWDDNSHVCSCGRPVVGRTECEYCTRSKHLPKVCACGDKVIAKGMCRNCYMRNRRITKIG